MTKEADRRVAKSEFTEVAMKNYTQVYVKKVLKQQKHTAKLLEQKSPVRLKTKITLLMSTVSYL